MLILKELDVAGGWMADKVYLDGEDVTLSTRALLADTAAPPWSFVGIRAFVRDAEGKIVVGENMDALTFVLLGRVEVEGFGQRGAPSRTIDREVAPL